LHENWVNTRRTTRTCFQCGKPGHFVADCPEKVENKDGYKHRSMCNHKHKNQNKDERRSRKKDGHDKKARAMVGGSEVDSSSAYCTSSSSSSEDEGNRCKFKKLSNNLSRLSCFLRDGFCGMAHSSKQEESQE
jgi:hypothetical protein